MAAAVDALVLAIERAFKESPCTAHTHGPLMVALAGVPGSGKSTVAQQAAEQLRQRQQNSTATIRHAQGDENNEHDSPAVMMGDVFVLGMDGFHLYRHELDAMADPQEAHRRRGAYWTFDVKSLYKVLEQLRLIGTVTAPSFDHALRDPVPDAIHIDARTRRPPVVPPPPVERGNGESVTHMNAATPRRAVVIVEGLYLLLRDPPEWARVADLFDLTVFLRCPIEKSTDRLIARHMRVWGVSREEASERAMHSDYENALLVMSTADNANVIVDSVDDEIVTPVTPMTM